MWTLFLSVIFVRLEKNYHQNCHQIIVIFGMVKGRINLVCDLWGLVMIELYHMNFLVMLLDESFISSGVPVATISPPDTPPPGPMSMI